MEGTARGEWLFAPRQEVYTGISDMMLAVSSTMGLLVKKKLTKLKLACGLFPVAKTINWTTLNKIQ